MSDEIKVTTEEKEPKCFCQSKGFRKFLIIALGSFVGVYCALCLFTALHKPPMCPFPPQGVMRGCPPQIIQHNYTKGDRHAGFHKKIYKDNGGRAPFEAVKPEIGD